MLRLSIEMITQFLTHMKTDPELTRIIKLYIHGQGEKRMVSIFRQAQYKDLAEVHNLLECTHTEYRAMKLEPQARWVIYH